MLNECRKYGDAAIAKGDNYSTESLFMVLILQQQKMINQLIKKLSRSQNETIKYYGDKAERI